MKPLRNDTAWKGSDTLSLRWERVCIVGVGLLGGSIGLSLRARNLATSIIGVCRSSNSANEALAVGAIDAVSYDLHEGCCGADVVAICAPVQQIAEIVEKVHRCSGRHSLIVDVGSTKASIAQRADALGIERFLPSHPLAGSERSGVVHARDDLFQHRCVIVTPLSANSPSVIEQGSAFWSSLGAHVIAMSPKEHDRAIASTSHLPHLVASALATATPIELLGLAATGWADTTRVAAGNPDLWCQIVEENREPILSVMKNFATIWQEWIAAIDQPDPAKLRILLEKGKLVRDALGNRHSSD